MQQVVNANLGFRPEAVCDPLVFGYTGTLTFCFLVTDTAEPDALDGRLAVFKTRSCLLYKYGYPNDEAQIFHSLCQSAAMRGGTIARVLDSAWLAEIEALNRKSFPESNITRHFEHWVFAFKETVLEVIVKDMSWTITEKPYDTVRMEMLEWLMGDGFGD